MNIYLHICEVIVMVKTTFVRDSNGRNDYTSCFFDSVGIIHGLCCHMFSYTCFISILINFIRYGATSSVLALFFGSVLVVAGIT